DNDGQITAVAPAGSAGMVDVTVVSPGGTSASSSADLYTYDAPPPPKPAVSSLAPTQGPIAGGTSVTITGSAFTGATAVKFGASTGRSFELDNDGQITAAGPAGPAGTVDVTVTTPGGTSATS